MYDSSQLVNNLCIKWPKMYLLKGATKSEPTLEFLIIQVAYQKVRLTIDGRKNLTENVCEDFFSVT